MITDRIGLHSVLLQLWIALFIPALPSSSPALVIKFSIYERKVREGPFYSRLPRVSWTVHQAALSRQTCGCIGGGWAPLGWSEHSRHVGSVARGVGHTHRYQTPSLRGRGRSGRTVAAEPRETRGGRVGAWKTFRPEILKGTREKNHTQNENNVGAAKLLQEAFTALLIAIPHRMINPYFCILRGHFVAKQINYTVSPSNLVLIMNNFFLLSTIRKRALGLY